jgi:hypothetical protein
MRLPTSSRRPRLVPHPADAGFWLAGVAVVLGLFELTFFEDHTAARLPAATAVLVGGTLLLLLAERRLTASWREAVRRELDLLRRYEAKAAWQAAAPEVFVEVLRRLLELDGCRFARGAGLPVPAPDGFALIGTDAEGRRLGVTVPSSAPGRRDAAAAAGLGLALGLDRVILATPADPDAEAVAYAAALPARAPTLEVLGPDDLARRLAELPVLNEMVAWLRGAEPTAIG